MHPRSLRLNEYSLWICFARGRRVVVFAPGGDLTASKSTMMAS